MAESPTPSRSAITDAKRMLLEVLKRSGGSKVTDLADHLGITPNAVRQHLEDLESNGLVERSEPTSQGGRGRPSATWSMTELALELFPDRHRDLTIELIASIRRTVGEEGLRKVVHDRSERQLAHYRESIPQGAAHSLIKRASALARVRSAEGYMAEAIAGPEGSVTLVEHHCPISDAAEACTGLCSEELEVFRAALGPDVTVERTSHLLAGDRRCAYRLTPSNPATEG
ncbi:MAG: metalloregulator ArsR/SmtB family transcription factor [Acidimicrobiales bacterium]